MDPNGRYRDASELKKALLANRKNASGLKLPGYRSGAKAPAIVASLIYAFIPFFSIINLIDGKGSNFLFGIGFSIAVILAFMIVFNYREYLSHLPGMNISPQGLRFAIRGFYTLILLFFLLILLGLMTDLVQS